MSTATGTRVDLAVRTASDLFFNRLSCATTRVLLLDYDGTIAPFAANRNLAFPYPTVPELLDCIMSTCRTRLVLISGRAAREIPPLLGLDPHPEVWGACGFERLHVDGRYYVTQLSDEVQHALTEADAWLEKEGLHPLVELKPGAVAVHWRGLNSAEAEETRARTYRILSPIALRTRLLLSEFDGGMELRARMCTKADAVRCIVSEIEPDVPIAYLGDDSTDEDAFRALNDRGLTVLVRPTYRFTAAQTWLRPPAELLQFLADWVRACGGDL